MTLPRDQEDDGNLPQAVVAPLTRAAIFIELGVKPDPEAKVGVLSLCGDIPALVRSVGQRGPGGQLSCVVGFGDRAWDSLFGQPRPAELHAFREIVAGGRRAVSTQGDVLFHIRAQRMDLCFELAMQIMLRLGGSVAAVDEVHGFRYFDNRSLIGFVDGTENPQGQAAVDATLVGDEDPGFSSGSYAMVQKYLHDISGWSALKEEEQERIIGRSKLADVELLGSAKPTYAHNALTTIVEGGREVKILRDNMAFGDASKGEYGTYFIGYSRSPSTTEKMLQNMFVGDPPGNYDRLLDFSRAVTGSLYFVPSATLLERFTKG
jgi:putative iron-dependent peroxidase